MYMGHVAVGLGSKRFAPTVPLYALVLAPLAPDLGDIVLGIVGAEHMTHYSHCAPAIVVWAVLAGASGMLGCGRAGWILAALAATHIPLDYLTSYLRVWPDSAHPAIGLGLYAQPMIDLAMEVAVIAAGWWLYRGSLPRDRRNHWAVIAIAVVLVVFQAIWAAMSAAAMQR